MPRLTETDVLIVRLTTTLLQRLYGRRVGLNLTMTKQVHIFAELSYIILHTHTPRLALGGNSIKINSSQQAASIKSIYVCIVARNKRTYRNARLIMGKKEQVEMNRLETSW